MSFPLSKHIHLRLLPSVSFLRLVYLRTLSTSRNMSLQTFLAKMASTPDVPADDALLPSKNEHYSNSTSSNEIEPAAAVANGSPLAKSPSPPAANGMPTSPLVSQSNPMGSGAAQTVSSKDPKAAAAAASDMRNVVRRKLTGYVGFANLPNQWHRKSVRKGFNFNVMVVGTYFHPVAR